MGSFFQKLFPKEILVDQEKIDDQINLSFNSCQFDKSLFISTIESGNMSADYQDYLSLMLHLSLQKDINLDNEITNLCSYLQFFKIVNYDSFFYKIEIRGMDSDNDCPQVSPLILFPLVKNALYGGYNTMEKFPVRIRINLIGKTLKLEVSNRVNHYVENQELNQDLRWFKTRLEAQYADRYTLLFNSNTSIFKATLILLL
ncbi:LytS family sensor histidine kinase [Sphingobacterium rhinopitheci]|uniref:hypothetical protein n=1 Tax=Sphingobacterium rhinopitheci TaxID=2781960 RepID=UPI001F519046|nr:hypothetical protein [Sphingobacterium rhinopitheci]MCI0922553.1 hypothetical protein [Sphingobacterium rhinopitheci]